LISLDFHRWLLLFVPLWLVGQAYPADGRFAPLHCAAPRLVRRMARRHRKALLVFLGFPSSSAGIPRIPLSQTSDVSLQSPHTLDQRRLMTHFPYLTTPSF
jgi:hypothetical protein